jgi:DNA-binding MarR family transcriptional regulator
VEDAQGFALLQQHTRLRIMGMLYRHRDVSARGLRQALGLTDGNLASHAARLAEAGLLRSRNALGRDGFEVRHAITPQGSETFRAYLHRLRELVEEWEPGPTRGAPSLPGPA